MTWMTKIALKKRWVTVLLTALVTGASIWAMLTLKMELIPDIELPMTTVITVYPGAQPDEVAEKVTIPVEGTVTSMDGLKHVTSSSYEGSSVVFFQFEFGIDMEKVNAEIASSLDQLDLPPEVRNLPAMMPDIGQNPRLWPINMNLLPVVTLSLGGDLPAEELKQLATNEIIPRLQEINGVLSVSAEGGTGDKILVSPDLDGMIEHEVSTTQLIMALATQPHNSLEELENTVLTAEGLLLNQVADISLGQAAGTAISRANGKPSISISVTKEAEANTVTTANTVLDVATEIAEELPEGIELITILDQSEYIENSVSDLTNNVVVGSVLAILVVFLFLMAFRASLVTAVSIPLSLLFGFLLMRFTGTTINILTLSAMIIAVGRVIDNSIVILEILYRRMQHGESFYYAAINGVREVVTPITSATIATVIIFVPLIFVGGIVGEMFLPFGLTITFALIGSLLIALTVVPALCGYLIRIKTQAVPRAAWYLKLYSSMLRWCLNHRVVTLVVSLVLFLGSFLLVPIIGTTFMPEMNTNMLTVGIEMPKGTDLATLKEVAVEAEDILGATAGVRTYNTIAGASTGTGGELSRLFSGGGSSNYATIEVLTDSGTDVDKLVEQLEKNLGRITKLGKITVSRIEAMGGAMTSGLEITVRGENLNDVILAANQLLAEIETARTNEETDQDGGALAQRLQESQRESLRNLEDIRLDIAGTEPRLLIEPDTARLMSLGFTPEQLGQLQQQFLLLQLGGTVGQANLNGVPYEVYLEGIAGDLTDINLARELLVGWPTPVPLGDIATVDISEQASRVSREDGKVSATITATILQENVGEVNAAVQSEIDTLNLPAGVEISMGGITEDMTDSFSAMFIAIPIAMALAYIILVITFRSLHNPLIIMLSMPLASIGALVGLLITGRPLGVSGLMGVLMLVGIVLTNAVVLVAVVEQMRKEGTDAYQALVEGARTRLRPILMTALTTMIAMLPLAFGVGEGVMMAAELATVVIGGLFSSTLLTLLVIPVVYAMVNRVPRTTIIRNKAERQEPAAIE